MPAKKKTATKAKTKPYLLPRHEGLYLKMTPTKGRGVFCTKALKKGTLLEATPALHLTEKQTRLIEQTLLCDYVFVVGRLPKDILKKVGIKKYDDASCVLYGLMSFCNHDDEPGAEIRWEVHDGTVYHTLHTLKDIPANTEICTSYGKGWFDEPHRRS